MIYKSEERHLGLSFTQVLTILLQTETPALSKFVKQEDLRSPGEKKKTLHGVADGRACEGMKEKRIFL